MQWQGQGRSLNFALIFKDFCRRSLLLAVTEACVRVAKAQTLEMASKGPDLWTSFVNNPYGPLRNKGVQDHFPPGSTFKVFTAIAALESGVIDPKQAINCPGVFRFGNRPFYCHKKEGHGPVDLIEAIRSSCDVYFWTVASRMSVDTI
jgi:cell division protein FtsI/penicillin-binding protein 2